MLTVARSALLPVLLPALLLLFTGLIDGCSSGPATAPAPGTPAWVGQPTRTVDGGYIVYVGTAQDSRADRAQTMAEMAAVEDLANECSFVPKGTRTEDRFLAGQDRGYKAYAKVAIEFQDCEQAKSSVQPDEIRKLANQRLTEQLAQYQQLALSDETEGGPEEGAAADIAAGASGSSGATVASSSSSSTGSGPRYAPIQTTTQFFVVRQQVAYQKEVVILSPPATYAPGTPQTTRFVSNVTPAATQVQTYEKANPQLRSSPQTWSSLPERPTVAPPAGMRRTSASMASPSSRGQRSWRQGRQSQQGQKQQRSRRRRRRGN